MYSFTALASRTKVLEEARSPYEHAHPKFGELTSTMRAKGFPSAPYDTIKFIAQTLYYLDIIEDEEHSTIMKSQGFTGKKQALLNVLATHADVIRERQEEITQKIEEDLPNYVDSVLNTRGALTNRGEIVGRKDKYDANALAQQMAQQAREFQKATRNIGAGEVAQMFATGLGDASEQMLVLATVDKVIEDIRENLGDEGVDIDEEALSQVENYVADNVKSIKELRQFIKKISQEPGYDKIAAYLSGAIEPAKQGLATLKTAPFEDINTEPGNSTPRSSSGGQAPKLSDISFGEDEPDQEDLPDFDDKDLEDTTGKDWSEVEHPLDKGDYSVPTEDEPEEADYFDDDMGLDIDQPPAPKELPPPPPKPQAPAPLKRKPISFSDISFGVEEEEAPQEDTIQFSGDESIGEFNELLQNHPNATISIDTDVDHVTVDVVGGRIAGVYSTSNPENSYNADLINTHIKRWFSSPSVTIGRIITAAGEKTSPYTESYTTSYMPKPTAQKVIKEQNMLTRDRFKPKSMWQM